MVFKPLALFAVAGCLILTPLFAQSAPSVEQQLADMKKQIEALQNKSASLPKSVEGDHDDKTDQLFDWGLSGTAVLQTADNVNSGTGNGRSNTSFSIDFTAGKVWENLGAEVFIEVEAGTGLGMDSSLNLYSGVNYDAIGDGDNDIHISELWYKQMLFGNKASFQVGKINPSYNFDGNAYAGSCKTQFLNYMFNINPAIEYAFRNVGFKAGIYPAKWLEVYYGLIAGDNISAENSLFNIGEIVIAPEFFGQRGAYRFTAWNNTSDHTKWSDPTVTNKSTYGFALSFDQDINENFGLFARYGWQNPEVYNPQNVTMGQEALNYSIEHVWAAGIHIKPAFMGRSQDILALGVGQVMASKDYKNSNPALNGDNEFHLEVFYNIAFNEHFSVTPSFQYIKNPFGNDVADMRTSIVLGTIRAHYKF